MVGAFKAGQKKSMRIMALLNQAKMISRKVVLAVGIAVAKGGKANLSLADAHIKSKTK
jgi:hypothetical protein